MTNTARFGTRVLQGRYPLNTPCACPAVHVVLAQTMRCFLRPARMIININPLSSCLVTAGADCCCLLWCILGSVRSSFINNGIFVPDVAPEAHDTLAAFQCQARGVRLLCVTADSPQKASTGPFGVSPLDAA